MHLGIALLRHLGTMGETICLAHPSEVAKATEALFLPNPLPYVRSNPGSFFAVDMSTLVSVVDDDESVRESLPDLLREFGFAVSAFDSAEAFLASDDANVTSCLLLDVSMPRVSGLDLHQALKVRGRNIPVIFITAHGDPADRLNLLAVGAIDCLVKPFSETALLKALAAAFPIH